MENVGLYEYIRQKAPTDYKALKKKIDEFTKEGIELQRISSTIKQYLDLKSFCQTLNISNADYIDFLQAIRMARFLDAKFNSKESLDIMQKTLIYKSNEVCIFKPTNFKESNIIGLPEWCFSKSQGHWDEHYIGYHESIYYVYDVMRSDTFCDFVAITVRPNGTVLVLDKNHDWWSKKDSLRFVKGLGNGASLITTQDGKCIKSENKEYKTNNDMNKNRIKITESELKQIVAESVKKVLKESYNDNDTYMSNYNDAMSDMYESLSVDSILKDLKYEGGVDLGECPHIWGPANWEDVLQYATEFGYKPEEVRECILKDLNSEIKWIQKSIDAVKNWRFQE